MGDLTASNWLSI